MASATTSFCAEEIANLTARASKGESGAQMRLAEIYAQGIGVEKDIGESVKWCRLAADAGLVEAQYNLGIVYLHGVLGEKDTKQAIVWLKRAADQKHLGAISDLGRVYSTEPSVMDEAEAMKWYRIGANLDDIDSMLLLAHK